MNNPMTKVNDPGQAVCCLSGPIVRAIIVILALTVGTPSARTYAAEPGTGQAQDIQDDRKSSDRSDDSSENFHPAAIKFAPCPENPGAAGVECGKLAVPVDYDKPRGESVGVAVIRARATDPGRRIGVLFANPGGPGISGVDFILTGLQIPGLRRLRERFDIVSFDVRGSHRSRPVRCEVEPASAPTDLDDAALATFFDDFSM
jgi:pimeloyl-ACP methyl ester carboxylesterase